MWYISTMKDNLADEKNDIMEFSGKWLELE